MVFLEFHFFFWGGGLGEEPHFFFPRPSVFFEASDRLCQGFDGTTALGMQRRLNATPGGLGGGKKSEKVFASFVLLGVMNLTFWQSKAKSKQERTARLDLKLPMKTTNKCLYSRGASVFFMFLCKIIYKTSLNPF